MAGDDTESAPPDWAGRESVLRDAEVLKEEALSEHIAHVIPSILMILNGQGRDRPYTPSQRVFPATRS